MEQRDRFGDLLRLFRHSRGLTQEDLAEASGSSVRTIREMERGRVRTPQRRTTVLLADALGLDGAERGRFLDLARGGPDRTAAVGDPGPTAVGGPAGSGAVGAVPGELPAAVPELIGRAGEFAVLSRLIAGITDGSATTASVIVLHGPPGTGKTSLAVAAGHRFGPAFPGGQLFADVRGAAPSDPVRPAEASAGFLRSLGVPDERIPVSVEQRGSLFRTLTRDRPLLIVIDNAADEAQVRPLLPAGRRCLTIITSRRPLTGLTGAVRVPVGLLDPEAARRLLVSIVGVDRVTADPIAADQLVKLCGRLPLAIRIAANRLVSRPQWPIRQLVGLLRDQRRRLAALTAGDLDVRAAFEVSYRQLDPAVATVFRRASLIPGADFDAALIAAAAGSDVESAASAAEELVDAGLLLSPGGRYEFHDLVRIYARERFAEQESPDCRRTAHDGMVSWLLRRTERAGAMFDPDADRTGSPFASHRAAGAWLDREAGSWLAALREAARQGRHRDVVRVARALHWYSDTATHRHGWDEIFSLGVTAAQACGRPRDEAVLLNFLGWARYFCRDRNSDGLAALERALALARQIGDRREEAWSLTYHAVIYVRTGRAGAAVDFCRQAVRLFREVGYPLGENCAANVQGTALVAVGRFGEAAELHDEVLGFYRRGNGLSSTGALVGQAATMMCLGAALAGMGRWREAAQEYARARTAFRRCGTTFAEATAAYRHGLGLRELGDVGAADTLHQALALFASVSSPWWEAQVLHALATLADPDPTGVTTARLLRRQALDRCGELDAPEVRTLRSTLRRELAD